MKNNDLLKIFSDDLSKENLILGLQNKTITFDGFHVKWSGDKDIALVAVKADGFNLKLVSEELQNDKDVVLAAINTNPFMLVYASLELQNDKELVVNVINKNGLLIDYASDEIKADKEMVLLSIKQNGNALLFADKKMQSNREVVIAAMNSRLDALSHASEELQNDFELLSWLKTVKNVPDNKKQWFEERMKVLEILEDEAWMTKNNLVAKQSVKPKKF